MRIPVFHAPLDRNQNRNTLLDHDVHPIQEASKSGNEGPLLVAGVPTIMETIGAKIFATTTVFVRISGIIHQRRRVSCTLAHVGERVSRIPRTVSTSDPIAGVRISLMTALFETYSNIVVRVVYRGYHDHFWRRMIVFIEPFCAKNLGSGSSGLL